MADFREVTSLRLQVVYPHAWDALEMFQSVSPKQLIEHTMSSDTRFAFIKEHSFEDSLCDDRYRFEELITFQYVQLNTADASQNELRSHFLAPKVCRSHFACYIHS